MPRPRTRTERLTETERDDVRHHFGTFSHAFNRLIPYLDGMPWSVFRLVVGCQLSSPESVTRVRHAVRAWRAEHLRPADHA